VLQRAGIKVGHHQQLQQARIERLVAVQAHEEGRGRLRVGRRAAGSGGMHGQGRVVPCAAMLNSPAVHTRTSR
jgi:hypothetical protein